MLHSKGNTRFQILANICMLAVTLMVVVPFLLVFISSITDENVLISNGYSFFPEKLSLYAYQYISGQGGKIFRAYGMTILVTAVGTAVNLLMSSMMAYVLSVRTLPFRRAITFYIFFTMLFGGGLVPTYMMYVNTFHIKNTIWALVVPGLMLSANNVLLIRTYYVTSIPEALYESAEIDGAGRLTVYRKIVLPLGKPILVTMGLFTGLAYWNDWTNGLYYLSGKDGQRLYTIQNLLNEMITNIQYLASGKVQNVGAEVNRMPTVSVRMAIAFVAMLPLLIIYPFLQKYFAEGITVGAVKG